ncbi:DUF6443 domain-containing protein [Tenacibaculum amylolyticum]|uniref:DUF6443 domain-containing protein n=1 Tax=Tenacibaculum amylolyticum TaxID=104269 RepID=UPI003895245A
MKYIISRQALMLSCLFLTFSTFIFSQSNENYVKRTEFNSATIPTTLILDEAVSNTSFTAALSISLKPGFHGTPNVYLNVLPSNSIPNQESITYYDGLGKPKQQIAIAQSPEGKDIIQHLEYDEFGRASKQFLPYESSGGVLGSYRTGANIATKTYYQNNYPEDFVGVNDVNLITPYSQKTFELSPLNRLEKQSSPGELFKIGSGHELKFENKINISNEVKKYTVNSDGTLDGGNLYYNEGELIKNVSKGQNWKVSDGKNYTTEEFKDKLGKIILKRVYNDNLPHDTYFVYDDFDNLKYVLPPKLVEAYSNNTVYSNYTTSWSLNDFLQDSATPNSLSFEVINDIININGTFTNSNFSTFKLNSSTSKNINITPSIPNMSIGTIRGLVGWHSLTIAPIYEDVGEIKIENGNLVISRIEDRGFFHAEINISKTLANSSIIPQEILNNLAYQYKYDEWNRLVEKKLPGKQWEYVIYDSHDKPILTQDGALRSDNLWAFTKYDNYGRIIYKGLYSSTKSRNNLQVEVDSYIDGNNKNNSEERISSTKIIGQIALNYSNTAFPITNITEVLSVSYYDDYNFVDSDKPAIPSSVLNQTITTRTNGLMTASWIKTLNQNTWSKAYTFYDEKARALRVHSKNHLGGYTVVDSQIDFGGTVTKTISSHKKTTSEPLITIVDEFEYDHAKRLKKQVQQINNGPKEVIAANSYDGIGMLVEKKVGGATTTPLQTIDYKYNIKGALTHINDVNSDLSTASDNDIFAFKLNYEKTTEGTASVPQLFNGNVTQTIWKNSIINDKQSYTYNYDALSRITGANYRKGNSLNTDGGKFGVSNITYDKGGNIGTLQRTGVSGQIDNLTYTYEEIDSQTTNKLVDVVDSTNNPEGYRDTNASGENFSYDSNGRLIGDKNKGITNIFYNHLDLPKEIIFSNGNKIEIIYDAAGNKLEKLFITSGGNTKTLYVNGFQYQNDQLQFFPHSEGYTYKAGSDFKYAYVYNDHLGNNRVSYSDVDGDGTISSSEIFSKTDYYPFGLTHNGEHIAGIGSNYNYKYQGKELQIENNLQQYDFGSRVYDGSIGRWFVVDPQGDQFYWMSPYGAMGNNPIVVVDPDGEFWFVLAGALIGGYIGASLQQKSFNPGNWGNDWWKGALVGSVLGAYGAQSLMTGLFKGSSFFAGKKTVFTKILMASGKAMKNSYISGLTSNLEFDENGLTVDFSFDLDKALKAGALAGVGSLIGGHLDKLYKPATHEFKNGGVVEKTAASGLLKDSKFLGNMSRNLASNVTGGVFSNLIDGKPAFKNLSYLKFANGLVEFGEGKKIVNTSTSTLISNGVSFGKAAYTGTLGDFDFNNFSFDSSETKAVFKYKVKEIFPGNLKVMDILPHGLAVGASLIGTASVIGLKVK